jgi:hypothetical protein
MASAMPYLCSHRPQEDYYAAPNNALVDPYYFPSRQLNQPTKTPELKSSSPKHFLTSSAAGISDPATPGRDPAVIDRRALVGVGELATPRWTTRHDYPSKKDWEGKGSGVEEVQELYAEPEPVEDMENDVDRSSPWTIEAIDDIDISEQKDYVSLVSPCWPSACRLTDGEPRSWSVRRRHLQCTTLNHPPRTRLLHAPCALAGRSRRARVRRSSIHVPSSKPDLRPTAVPGHPTRVDNLLPLVWAICGMV